MGWGPFILDGLQFKRQIGVLTGGADLEENGVAGMSDGIMLTLNGQVSADGVFSGIEVGRFGLVLWVGVYVCRGIIGPRCP